MATRTTEKSNHAGNGAQGGKPKSVKRSAGNPRCAAAGDGIATSRDFASFMSLLVGDIISGRIDPRTANAACNAGGKLLKVVELEHKYGKPQVATAGRTLQLTAIEAG